MVGTIRIDDMRLFASVAAAKSFTTAAKQLGVPKQTLSRRVAELERALGVELMVRTTRRLNLTEAGATYAERCSELVRLAEDANRAVTESEDVPRGTLRITADPVFGEAFLTDLVIEYAQTWPEVQLEVVLSRRRVDLIAERFDIAFRIGQENDPELSGRSLGPARICYCASPAYIARRGTPSTPKQLPGHECLIVSDGGPVRWPFAGGSGSKLLPIAGRLVFTSFAMARAAALAGLGIALFPEFACAEDIRRKRLVPVLERSVTDVGSIWLIHPAHRHLAARVRMFIELAHARFGRQRPWEPRRRRRK